MTMDEGRSYDAHLHLLDRQVLDADGRPVAKVDDIELATDANGRLYCATILCGPAALGERIGGWFGRLMVRRQAGWHPSPEGPYRIPFSEVAEITSAVVLGTRRRQPGLEDWLREHIIERIPGASHESDE